MALLFDVAAADEYGLVGIGGDLAPANLLAAYCQGVFPWFDENNPVLWWSPQPRAIFDLDRFHVSRRLARTLRSGRFRFTINHAFRDVIRGCAQREEGTWIIPEVITAYTRLWELGIAHSVEAWQDGELAGGIYGVAIRGFFAGESMFHRRTDASKAALAFLIEHLRRKGFLLFDIQMITEHTRSLGAIEISRAEYLRRLKCALEDREINFLD